VSPVQYGHRRANTAKSRFSGDGPEPAPRPARTAPMRQRSFGARWRRRLRQGVRTASTRSTARKDRKGSGTRPAQGAANLIAKLNALSTIAIDARHMGHFLPLPKFPVFSRNTRSPYGKPHGQRHRDDPRSGPVHDICREDGLPPWTRRQIPGLRGRRGLAVPTQRDLQMDRAVARWTQETGK